MNESLLKTSLNRFKANATSYIAVGLLCGLFLILVSTLSFVDEIVLILAVPLLAFPFLFASHISCYLLEAGETINLGNFFRYFFGFFRPQFRGSFRGIISFLKSLAVYFATLAISYIVMYFVFKGVHGAYFTDAVDDLIKQYTAGLSYEELLSVLESNDGLLLTFLTYVSTIPIPFTIAWFIYQVSFFCC